MLYPLSRRLLETDIVLPIFASAAVLLRFVARKSRKIPLEGDDWLILVALILALGVCANGIYASSTNVFGKPFADLTLEEFQEHGKLLWADVLMCHTVYGFIKISVALFYKRIFVTPWFRRTIHILIGVDVCWMITATFGHIFSAWPVSNWWIAFDTDMNYDAFLLAMASFDVLLDIVTLCLPLPVIKKLHMTRKRKVLLAGVFALGWFCVVASLIRLYYTERLLLSNDGKLPPVEITGIQTWNDIWAHIEACVSIITACLPAIAPLFKGRLSASSLLHSFWSLPKVGSGLSFKRQKASSKEPSSMGSGEVKRAWYELHPTQLATSATANSGSEDNMILLEEGNTGIKIQKSFVSQYEQV